MNKLTITDLVQKYCRLAGKWAVVLFPDQAEDFLFEEIKKAVPFLKINPQEGDDDIQAIVDGVMIVLCDTERECNLIFEQIKGNDKPENNDYDGPCHVYAWICNTDGEVLNENT